ncbi:M-phase phosphoprotein 9 isoform X2 [Hypomesus transpacificus]|uniref:M-phase phosphoprotein 9 isoform X2 n=1 Tax=Hypomesus transpacificus TaxID=137520 RepID=UPI001F07AA9D|nr:M-phase phosphoprotein 9 isoform X2 [Hypomesus transpacificus]
MSTDDSISEDVSSSGALSHCHVDANGDEGKESEASLVSSEGTSASGLAGPEDGHTHTSQTTVGAVESRSRTITSACSIPQKIRSLCLSTEEAFGQGRSLPFINPSSLETLRALVKEIQSSGETDPEMWKDCEGRWLHLFQLVEKQYQEQILAQQEQYQCQIQLIQDEIKALVQLQHRSSTPFSVLTQEHHHRPTSHPPTPPADLDNGTYRLAAPPSLSSTSPSPPPPGRAAGNPGESADARAATVLSSGYGTLSAWETGPDLEDPGCQESSPKDRTPKEGAGSLGVLAAQHGSPRSSSQPLTSWAQRQKLRAKKSKPGPGQPSSQPSPQPSPQPLEQLASPAHSPLDHTDLQDQHRSAAPSTNSFPLGRSDSLLSEASGLTYWRLDESDLYRPLPDSFDSGAYLLLHEASMSVTPPEEEEPKLSLREIYQSKQRESKHCDWDGSVTPSPMSPQVLTLDPTVHVRQSDRTSGFTSPSHFSSPSFPAPPHQGYPGTPDSMADTASQSGDTDCTSNASSLSAPLPTPAKGHPPWESPLPGDPSTSQSQHRAPASGQPPGARAPLASEEEGSRTHAAGSSRLSPWSRDAHTPPGVGSQGAGRSAVERAASLEDPVVVSLLRQNLREKHSRHVADLKAYYEAEIRALRDQLSLRDLPQDLEKSNLALQHRCDHLERALTQARSCIQELENNNCILEKKLADWPERYAVAGAMVTALQQRLEESKRTGGEKEAQAARVRARVRQLEEEAQRACGEAGEKEARREREYNMLQDLLGEYDSLRKDHEGVKDNLVSTENKLFDANEQISDLKRVISKLESQVKQLEHENQARMRFAPHSHTQPSGAGLYHHPDLLLSPSKHLREPENTYRRSSASQSDQSNGSRKSTGPQSDQSNGYRKSTHLQTDQSGCDGSMNNYFTSDSRRCPTPPEREQGQGPEQGAGLREPGRRDGPLTPVMRALIELEETRATESRAPWLANGRPTVGFVERSRIESVQERGRAVPAGGVAGPERGGAGPERCGAGPERGGARPERGGPGPERGGPGPERGGAGPARRVVGGAALLRAQRSLSPEGHRSSSLPPQGQHTFPPSTPTKRETLIKPLSAKSSPKRCPTENFSTAFGQPLPRQQYLHNRFDVPLDQRRHSFHSASPRKRLHFTALDRQEASQQSCVPADSSEGVDPGEGGPRLGWVELGPGGAAPDLQDSREEAALSLQPRLHSLADAERLFDELTQEKQQIESALSRMPGAGGRVSLQTRLDEVALENRLERVNRDLGSIRMTLKRFHILRSSVNI